ncbi:hypothetical protein FHS82_000397 [Pseudochelatococcus lubricantis]|uniref:Probable membrane transporter protein n=1 Tax=Pseudochelatococcus lubricantis TaxID=1538102 RepID=A0ABX0UUF2_9HYPH|nr:TSUP family transporter [Pseudochelatococcus lubricantis]NIJ56584.1 hypothetical protein [Pseudochelatococcus lubricantis]
MVAVLAAVGVVAGFIDAIAGGGGLLTVPALLSAGLDPVAALATNKLQSSFGSFSAALTFARAGKMNWREAAPMAGASFAGAVAGASLIKAMPANLLAGIMPLLLIAVAIYFMASPRVSAEEGRARVSPRTFTFTVALGVGFYDGCFGPGTGSFFMIGFVSLLGLSIMRAVAHTKLLNFASNIGALLFFAFTGGIHLIIGVAMGLGQYAGARLGARMALRNGARIIRPLLVTVSCAMAARLLLDPANPLRNAVMSAIGTLFAAPSP